MHAGCGRAGDYAGVGTNQLLRTRVFIELTHDRFTVLFNKSRNIHPQARFYLYVNGVIYDTDTHNDKQYSVPYDELLDYQEFTVVAVSPTMPVFETYDPLCGSIPNTFERYIRQDIIPIEDQFTPRMRSLTSVGLTKLKNNYIGVE
jgi:hypothetical protein